MAQNEIEEKLVYLRWMKVNESQRLPIEKLEMVLRVLRTFIKCHRVLFFDSSVELTKNAKSIVEKLDGIFQGTIYIRKRYVWMFETQVPHLLEFFEGNTGLSYKYELNDFDLSECMDCLGKNLHEMLMMFLERVRSDCPEENLAIHRFIMQLKLVHKKMNFLRYLHATEINSYIDDEKLECLETRIQFMASNVGQFCLSVSTNIVANAEKVEVEQYGYDILNKPSYLLCLIVLVELEMKKIFLNELKASKFTHSRTFKDMKLPEGFSHHLHSLLMYLRKEKLENFPDNVSAQNIIVAIEFLLVFLDADVSNHVINGNWLNEVMEKVGAIAGDVLYVIRKLLPSSINKDDTSKINLCSLQILEKTKDLKAQVETYYKSLKFTPSQFSTFSGLSFLDSLSRKLNEMTNSKSGLDFLMKPLLFNLEKELSSLTSILEKELSSIFIDVAKVHHEHKIPKVLHRRTINLAYESEVAIDSILSQYNAFLHIFCSLPSILKEIKQINAEVTEMRSADVALKPCYVVAPFKHLPTQHNNPVTDEEIVGFGIDTEKMIQYLIRGTNELDVVPIVGMGGQGKTTIARKVYNSDNIVSHFDVRAWCIVSQTYNRRTLLQEIFSQVTGSKDKGDKDDILADELRKSLMGKRYLIVFDDMWDCMAWDDLRLSFPDFRNRSRIVVTTRLEKVGEQVKYHTDPYSLLFLTTEESCQLLQKKVFPEEDCPPELQDVSQAVAEKCKGLPLVIVLVAGIIKKRKMEESWWNEVKDSLFDHLDYESKDYSRATMKLSFDNLADCLKPCLLYMGMFQEDTIIQVSELISLWVAEGFAQNSESAEDYLMDLISSNVVMLSKRSYNGKVKYCQIHDVVHHFCLEESRKEKFMLAVKGQVVQFQPLDWKGSRVCFSFSEKLSKSTSLRSKTQKPFHQHLRSLTMIGEYVDGFPLRSWIHTLRLLKVLNLSCVQVSYLSTATLKPLNHLKYIAVLARRFYFDPESRLPHLETLIVANGLCNRILLLASFWEMEKLRRVSIRTAEFDLEENKQGLSSKLENLRILGNIYDFPIDRMDVLSRRCPNLQRLNITFPKGDSDSAESFCLSLENLTELQELCLTLPWSYVVSGLQLPSKLNKLVLLRTHYTAIPFIAGLPSLEYLQLYDTYFPQSEEWCLGDITFYKLKLLKLAKLYISRWDASEESFPLLKTLVIKKCDDLEEIPLSFANIPTLKQIKLIGCGKKSLKDSAAGIKKDVEENEGNDRIDLIIKNY